MDNLANLSSKDFLKELESFRAEQQQLIEAECEGFDPGPKASKQRRERVFNEFRFFAKTYFPHYIQSEQESAFHQHVFDNLPAKIDAGEGCKEALAAPRGEAKSTLITQLFVLWCVITGRIWFAVIIMDAFDQSVMMLEAIKVELESNPRLKQDFPDETGGGRTWQAGVIVTRNGRKIQVAGAGKKLRGWRHGPHRPDLVVLDDIENDENVRNKDQRDKLYNWLNKVVLKLGPPDGSMNLVYLGTILHYDSVLNRVMQSPTWRSHRFQSILRWPDRMDLWEKWEEILCNQSEDDADAFYAQNKAAMDEGAVVSWPSTRPLVMLMKIRSDDHDAFDSEHQNDPNNDENAPFRDMVYWVQPCRDWVFFGACDPSLGKNNKRRDPSAILVGGYDRNHGILDVVEASVVRRVPDKIISDIIDFEQEYRCLRWVIETVQFQEFLKSEIVRRSAELGIHVPACGVIPGTDKDLRIESLQPHVANGSIRFHRNHTALNKQLRFYPEADHDDGPDCLHMLWMAAVSGAGALPKILSAARRPTRRFDPRQIAGH